MIKKAIVVCERSGIVRDALIEQGIDAISCDLAETESPGNHVISDFHLIDYSRYDLVIAHPDCRFLTKAGAGKFWNEHRLEQQRAVEDFLWLLNLPVEHICVENTAGYLSTVFRKPDQYIDPGEFGHKERKHTGLWLKNLPPLIATYICPKNERIEFVRAFPGNTHRSIDRAKTFTGIAQAMAKQWGCL
jgi:hypothetical protein